MELLLQRLQSDYTLGADVRLQCMTVDFIKGKGKQKCLIFWRSAIRRLQAPICRFNTLLLLRNSDVTCNKLLRRTPTDETVAARREAKRIQQTTQPSTATVFWFIYVSIDTTTR